MRPSPLKCPDGTWTNEAKEHFKQMVINKNFIGQVREQCIGNKYFTSENNFFIRPQLFGRGCDRMVVGFTTTYAISSYHH
jgi:hypothetical protein